MAFECLAIDMLYPSYNQHTIEVTGTPVLSIKWTFCGNSQVSIFWLVSWTKNATLWRVIMSGMMRYQSETVTLLEEGKSRNYLGGIVSGAEEDFGVRPRDSSTQNAS